MNYLIYTGSGPGAPETFLFCRPEGEAQSQPLSVKDLPEKLEFVTGARGILCGVEIREKGGDIYGINLRDNPLQARCLFAETRHAVYYPRLSPEGKRVVLVETPGRTYPPRHDDMGYLRVFERGPEGWEPLDFSAEGFVEPVDFSSDGRALWHVGERGSLFYTDIETGHSRRVAENGFFPVVSPSGDRMAFFDGDQLVVFKGETLEFSREVDMDVRFLTWAPDSSALYYVGDSGFWRNCVHRLEMYGQEDREVMETSEITSLVVMATCPVCV